MGTVRKNTNRGFTLIEIVVVMAIISILAVMIIASISAARRASRNSWHLGKAKEFQIVLEAYYTKHQKYPSIGGWHSPLWCPELLPDPTGTGCAGVTRNLITNGWLPNTFHVNPPTVNAFYYCSPISNPSKYKLWVRSEPSPMTYHGSPNTECTGDIDVGAVDLSVW